MSKRVKITFYCNECGRTVNRKENEPKPSRCPFCMGEIVTKIGAK